MRVLPASIQQPQVLKPEANLTRSELGREEPLRQAPPSLPDSIRVVGLRGWGCGAPYIGQLGRLHVEDSFLRDELAVLPGGGGQYALRKRLRHV